MNMFVHAATPEDMRPLVTFLIGRFHSEYAEWFPSVSVDKVIRYVGDLVENGVVFIAENDNGDILGVLSGKVGCYWFTDEQMVQDGFFYVAPEHRGTRCASALIKSLKAWADMKGLKLECAAISGGDVDRRDRFYERNGFARIGGVYRRVR